jgi:predicted MFS family arabinose efflux permease
VFRLLRRNRDFRALFIGEVVSLGGDWFATVAIVGVLSDATHGSAFAIAGIFVAQMLPSFLLSPFAGPVADRFDRRAVMVVTSVVATLAALGFLFVKPGHLWVAYVSQVLISSLAAFFAPAAGAAMPNLVDPSDLPDAVRATSSLWGIMLAVGSAAGALFNHLFGRNASFIANAASFAIAGAVMWTIRRSTNAETGSVRQRVHPIKDSHEAIVYARQDPTLLALIMAKGGVGLSGGVVALLTTLSVERFHAGDTGVGILLAARGIGVVVGPLWAKRYTSNGMATVLKICGLSCIVYGIGYVGVAVAPVIGLAALGTMVAHLGGGNQWSLSVYGIQARSSDEFRGRVLSADMAIVMLASTISYFVGAFLQRSLGTGTAMSILGVLAVGWGLLYLRFTRPLRDEDALQAQPA